MLQRRNTETLRRQARMMLGKLKLGCHRDWRESRLQELPLLHGKNKQGKYRFAAGWGQSTADTHKTELLNAFCALVFTNKVSQAFTYTESIQGEEEISTVEKNWSNKSCEKSWLMKVHESRWDASESAERADWWHIKAGFCNHGHGGQGKSLMNEEGQILRPPSRWSFTAPLYPN